MNKTYLLGRLAADVELRTNDKGTTVAKPTIAINNGEDKDGNEIPTDFIKFYAFNKTAENLAKFCKKGSQIFVDGRVKFRSWDKEDGNKGYETTIYANRIIFLDSKKSDGIPLPDEPQSQSSTPIPTPPEMESDPFLSFSSEIELDESELPF